MNGAQPGRSTGDSGSGEAAAIGCGEKGDDGEDSSWGDANATGDGCGCIDAIPPGCINEKGGDEGVCCGEGNAVGDGCGLGSSGRRGASAAIADQ